MGRIVLILLGFVLLNSPKALSQLHFRPAKDSLEKPVTFRPLPQNFYNKGLGFFCKKEIQLQKLCRLPIYFRLGSKEYVDRLEGKTTELRN